MKNFSIIKYFMFLLLSLFCTISLSAQPKEPFITFEIVKFDMGDMNEMEGKVKATFPFANSGSSPLIIRDVMKRCACISVQFPSKPVLPGETSEIVVIYNPKNRPGPFKSSLHVLSNALNSNARIEIEGMVIAKELGDFLIPPDQKYEFNLGMVRASSNHIAFSRIYYGATDTAGIEIYNPGKETVQLETTEVPNHLTVSFQKNELQPGASTKLSVRYHTEAKKDWGFVYDKFTLLQKSNQNVQGSITVTANIVENFDVLSAAQKANAPKISFESKYHSFDTLFQDTKAKHKYVFSNTGKSNLIIRKVKPSCGCTASHVGKDVIAPGEDGYIEATFDAGKRSGRQSKSITVVTNDPENPMVILKFNGVVVPNEK